jgi:hypothetical protein
MYAKPSSFLDSLAPSVLVADCGLLLVGTAGLRERTAAGACTRLPMSVAILVGAWRERGSASLQ